MASSTAKTQKAVATAAMAIRDSQQEPESMRKLRALREKIGKEFDVESKLRQESETKEPLVPLSLAPDYVSATKKKGNKGSTAAKEAQALAREAAKKNIKEMALQQHVRQDLEAEMEKKSQETITLKSQNARLRDIIQLRQESNQRRESAMETELKRLSDLSDAACVDRFNIDNTMGQLRTMNTEIQEGAAHLKNAIEEKAEAERLAMVRNYRVKIREVKQQLEEQRQANDEGATVWITKHRVLEGDRDKAAEALRQLEVRNEQLVQQNQELEVMLRHQDEQRTALSTRIAVVKRENRRVEDHVSEMEGQLAARDAGGSSPARSGTPATSEHAPGTRPATRGGLTAPTASSMSKVRGGSAGPQPNAGLPPQPRSAYGSSRADKLHADTLKRLRAALGDMRLSLKQVRSAHIELLQERTELEIFLRQCIEDVRRDVYRFTVVSNIGRSAGVGDLESRVLEGYSAADRKKLIDVLNSKLRVFHALHKRMFPQKFASGDPWDDDDDAAEATTAALLAEAGKDGLTTGHLPYAGPVDKAAERAEEGVAALAMDQLWGKWKTWTGQPAM